MTTVPSLTVALRREIAAYAPGVRLPTFRELMRRHGVSQSIVAQAFQTLRREGLIASHVGRGTFVNPEASQRRVLWVCGVDLYHGDISPYFSHQISVAGQVLAQRGYLLEPVWLSNFRVEEHAHYCTEDTLDRYAGFAFCGCAPEHRLMGYVHRNETIPSVRLTVWPPRSRQVAQDMPVAMALAFRHLRERGHREVTIITPEDAVERQTVMREIASDADVHLRWVQVPCVCWMNAYQAAGYRIASGLIANRELARAILVTDDTIAQGVTRALLANCLPRQLRMLDVVVMTARQTVMPLGLPVTGVVHDIEDVVNHAVEILLNQIEGRSGHADSYCAPASLLLPDELTVTAANADAAVPTRAPVRARRELLPR